MARFECKKQKRIIFNYINTYNHYVGKNDIFRIHVKAWRDGCTLINKNKIKSNVYFIEMVQDYYNFGNCDIYFKIDPEIIKGIKEDLKCI